MFNLVTQKYKKYMIKTGEINTFYYKSPVGILELVSRNNMLISCQFVNHYKNFEFSLNCEILINTINQLNLYFKGELFEFKLPLNIIGSNFSINILNKLRESKYGNTITYKDLAFSSGYKNAYRAVGTVMNKNKFVIIIPCHRVVSVNGIGGYAYGLEIKKYLLELEKRAISKK